MEYSTSDLFIRNTSKSIRHLCDADACSHDLTVISQKSSYAIYILLELIRAVAIPTVLTFVCCQLWTCYNIGSRDVTWSLPLPPGDFGLPFIGETLQLLFYGRHYFESRRRKHGNIYKTHILGRPTIRVIGHEHVKQIIRGEDTIVAAQWPTSTCILLGEGSVSSTSGSGHMTKKKTIMRAFTFRALSGYMPTIQRVTRAYIRRWCNESSILGYPEFKTMNFDLACQLLAGFQMNETECKRLMTVFETFLSNLFSLPINVPGSGLRKGLQARDILLEKIDEIIQNKETDINAHETDALRLIMNIHKDSLSRTELKNLCLELLFAGHGTTSTVASFLVAELAKRPDVRQKLRDEITAVGIGIPGNASDLDLQMLNQMQYLGNVVKEALRLCPPVGAGFRKVLKTFEINGYQIPKDWTVAYSIRDTHETSQIFSHTETFDPDRWNALSMSETRFHYLPFGGGKRICAGKDLAQLMLKLFAIELVRCSNWELVNTNTEFRTFPVPRPNGDLPLVFTAVCADFLES